MRGARLARELWSRFRPGWRQDAASRCPPGPALALGRQPVNFQPAEPAKATACGATPRTRFRLPPKQAPQWRAESRRDEGESKPSLVSVEDAREFWQDRA